MERIIIYGAGNTARFAYDYLSQTYDVYCFIDGKNPAKWGTEICGIKVRGPEILLDHREMKVVIASVYAGEIMRELRKYHLASVYVYQCGISPCRLEEMEDLLKTRTIDLGEFFRSHPDKTTCKELTFMFGGSGVLDYMFLKKVAEIFHCKEYLEIGTYIGESINILTDCCEKLYSITAPLDSEFSMRNYCRKQGITDYSGRLATDPKIIQYYADSKKFDYTQVSKNIDLFFIDGDHSYEGVYSDTKNIFSIRKEDAIVIWHDAKEALGSYNTQVLYAIQDALGDEFQNVYVTNRNMCGIYLPEKLKKEFPIVTKSNAGDAPLITYDVSIENYAVH